MEISSDILTDTPSNPLPGCPVGGREEGRPAERFCADTVAPEVNLSVSRCQLPTEGARVQIGKDEFCLPENGANTSYRGTRVGMEGNPPGIPRGRGS